MSYNCQRSMGVVEGSSGKLSPLLKIMRELGGAESPFFESLRLDKFIITHFPKEKKDNVRFYQKKKNATIHCPRSPSSSTFTYTGLTRKFLSYMQKWAWLKAWSTYFLQHSLPCYSFRTTLLPKSNLSLEESNG